MFNYLQLQPLHLKLSVADICPRHEHTLLFPFWLGNMVQVFLLHSLPVQEAVCIKVLKPGGKEPHSRPQGSILPVCKANLPTWVHVDHSKNLRRVPGEALAFPRPILTYIPLPNFRERQFYR